MTIGAHEEQWLEYRIQDYDPAVAAPVDDNVIYRLSVSYEAAEEGQKFGHVLDQFLQEPAAAQAPALVIGTWGYDDMVSGNSQQVVEALVAARERLPKLGGLFIGDIIFEECEVSWINQADMSPLLAAYPQLEHFRIRGSNGLTLGKLRHGNLRSLVIETGGLPASVIGEVANAELPTLEHLELWLGAADYGGIDDAGPLQALLAQKRFLKLIYLGLRDCEIADQVAQAVATAPILEGLDVLDLSLGNLGDEGARALLASPLVHRLKKLDIHHHYVSAGVVKALEKLGIEIEASDPKVPDHYQGEEYRFIALSE
jgi:hypothetical protein